MLDSESVTELFMKLESITEKLIPVLILYIAPPLRFAELLVKLDSITVKLEPEFQIAPPLALALLIVTALSVKLQLTILELLLRLLYIAPPREAVPTFALLLLKIQLVIVG